MPCLPCTSLLPCKRWWKAKWSSFGSGSFPFLELPKNQQSHLGNQTWLKLNLFVVNHFNDNRIFQIVLFSLQAFRSYDKQCPGSIEPWGKKKHVQETGWLIWEGFPRKGAYTFEFFLDQHISKVWFFFWDTSSTSDMLMEASPSHKFFLRMRNVWQRSWEFGGSAAQSHCMLWRNYLDIYHDHIAKYYYYYHSIVILILCVNICNV